MSSRRRGIFAANEEIPLDLAREGELGVFQAARARRLRLRLRRARDEERIPCVGDVDLPRHRAVERVEIGAGFQTGISSSSSKCAIAAGENSSLVSLMRVLSKEFISTSYRRVSTAHRNSERRCKMRSAFDELAMQRLVNER